MLDLFSVPTIPEENIGIWYRYEFRVLDKHLNISIIIGSRVHLWIHLCPIKSYDLIFLTDKFHTSYKYLILLQHQMLPNGEKSAESSILMFPSVSRSDTGTYICTADNGVGPKVTAVISLNVICEYFTPIIPFKLCL